MLQIALEVHDCSLQQKVTTAVMAATPCTSPVLCWLAQVKVCSQDFISRELLQAAAHFITHARPCKESLQVCPVMPDQLSTITNLLSVLFP